jgi:hypothetical protein
VHQRRRSRRGTTGGAEEPLANGDVGTVIWDSCPCGGFYVGGGLDGVQCVLQYLEEFKDARERAPTVASAGPQPSFEPTVLRPADLEVEAD